jgi:polar amino acid transport system permease protein
MHVSRQKPLRLGWIDLAVACAVLGLLAYTVHRIDSVLRYNWNWSSIPPFILRWDAEQHAWVANLLLQGFLVTLRLSIWGILVAALVGAAMGLCRTSRSLFLRMVSRSYVELIRNIPPLVFIFIFYFFISSQIMPLLGIDRFVQQASPATLAAIDLLFGAPQQFPAFVSGLICISLFEGAYVTEIVRAGIQSVEKGQWEASRALGLSKFRIMRQVIAPQAIQRIVPPLAGQFISLIKDSSIISLISIQELTFAASQVAIATTNIFEAWITAAAMYFVLCFACSLAFSRLEARMRWGSVGGQR